MAAILLSPCPIEFWVVLWLQMLCEPGTGEVLLEAGTMVDEVWSERLEELGIDEWSFVRPLPARPATVFVQPAMDVILAVGIK